jgi:hypothetical protein
MDIGKINVAEQNSSTQKTSATPIKKPSHLREGWEDIERRAEFFSRNETKGKI